jgi:hypothetical protein
VLVLGAVGAYSLAVRVSLRRESIAIADVEAQERQAEHLVTTGDEETPESSDPS